MERRGDRTGVYGDCAGGGNIEAVFNDSFRSHRSGEGLITAYIQLYTNMSNIYLTEVYNTKIRSLVYSPLRSV